MSEAAVASERTPRRAVNLSLDADVLLRAKKLTRNLSRTVEQLLLEFIEQEQRRKRESDEALDQVIFALNASHAGTGLLSDEFPSL